MEDHQLLMDSIHEFMASVGLDMLFNFLQTSIDILMEDIIAQILATVLVVSVIAYLVIYIADQYFRRHHPDYLEIATGEPFIIGSLS